MLSNRKLFLEYLAQTSPSPSMLEVEKAKGVFIYSPSGKKYFDLISGVNVSSVGHSHPKVIEAIKLQADNYLHTMVYGELIQSPQIKFAELLISYLPDNLESVYFVNSGAEAIEGAMKLAKRYTGRTEIISFKNAYHGSTQGALSIFGGDYLKQAYRPLLPGIRHLDFNDFDQLQRIGPETAAVVAEVLQAEAGMIQQQAGFLEALRKRCDEMSCLLILDEVQTGFGRIGSMFGFESYNIVPDILVLAKSLGGGMPLGAFISSREIMEVLSYSPELGHITTFGGHPVCCASGMAAMEVILDEDLVHCALEKETAFREKLKNPAIQEIRGRGLMLALDFKNKEFMLRVVKCGFEEGFITDWFLFCDTAIRISPPLNISYDEIEEATLLLDYCINKVKSQ
ncbi:MAG: aspartate aminotransferase family protein [Bacteroidales bacterium]|nr:aspartate aminotransferase family protein [Bacteroidales bacterium]MCF8391368.1 aspartate aminotransferase family protein [Bacteroidales bacterium]